MYARPGRKPAYPKGETSSLTLSLPAEVKIYLIEAADAVGMSIKDYIVAMVMREAGGSIATGTEESE